MMKKTIGILLLLILSVITVLGQASQDEIARVRQQMAKIRQTTNWNDPLAAKKANDEISKLAKQLMMGGNSQSNPNQEKQQNQDQSKDAQKDSQLKEEMVDQKMQIWNQVWESVGGGEGADVLLAEPLRKEIVEEYKEDEAIAPANEFSFKETTLLFLDMSSKTAQLTIDQMENYKSINTLIITGGQYGAPVDMNDLLRRAKNYPLQVLYIINFKQFIKSIPESIGGFRKLNELALFNNQIVNLPLGIGMLASLKYLYLDLNPITTLNPFINSLTKLDTLGVVKTNISEAELAKINQHLPNCKILK
jgi:Leucine-rich repeat (LRR) protein